MVRVKVIFMLPQRLQFLYSGPVAYVELFTKFGNIRSTDPARLHKVAQAHLNRRRQTLVIPLERLCMSCHLMPVFRLLKDSDYASSDILEDCQQFLFNPFSSNLMYSYAEQWEYGAR